MEKPTTRTENLRVRSQDRARRVAAVIISFLVGGAVSPLFRAAHAEEAGPSELHLIRLALQDIAKDTRELRKTPAAIDDLRKTCKK